MITIFLPADKTDFEMFSSFIIAIIKSRNLLPLIIATFISPCYAKVYDLVILGDSISSGLGVQEDENWVSLSVNELDCTPSFINLSIAGATSYDAVQILEHFQKDNSAKHMIVEIGGNDALRGLPLGDLENNINDIITAGLNNDSHIILVGIDLPQNYGKKYKSQFSKIFTAAAAKHSLDYLFLSYPQNRDLMQDDRIHPSVEGHRSIANEVAPIINAVVCHNQHCAD